MGWTLTTAMWRNLNPVTGQARISGTPQNPGMSASFNDQDGKPFVFQLNTNAKWVNAMTALGFYEVLSGKGFANLSVAMESEDNRVLLLATLDKLFATGMRDVWVAILRDVDIVSAPINTLLEASNDPDVIANGYLTEVEYPKYGKTLKVHGTPWQFSETPAKIGVAPTLGQHVDEVLGKLGYSKDRIAGLKARQVI
jgi:crotonobetainyl-CoA:carnitine CoA-transferase CaiB-like acyl-CoA transferase